MKEFYERKFILDPKLVLYTALIATSDACANPASYYLDIELTRILRLLDQIKVVIDFAGIGCKGIVKGWDYLGASISDLLGLNKSDHVAINFEI